MNSFEDSMRTESLYIVRRLEWVVMGYMGDADFARLVQQYTNLVFTACYRLVGDYHEAENLTQDTFLGAYLALDRFDSSNYKAWLLRIAVNKAKDYLKSAYIAKTQTMEQETLEAIAPPCLPDSDKLETIDGIERACAQLPEPYREIAQMHYLEGRSFEDIALLLNRPLKTVQTQGYRARDKLRIVLKEEAVC